MLEIYKKQLTKKGQQLHAKSLAGEKIEFTRFQFGSGTYTGTESNSYIEAMTALKHPEDSFAFSKVEQITEGTKSTCKLTLAASNAVEGVHAGYNITEIGEFARGGDGVEILYSILIAKPDKPEWFPAYDEETPATLKYYDYISVGNAEKGMVSVGAGGIALQEDLETLEGRVLNLERGAASCIGIRRKCQTDGTPQSVTKWERWGQYTDAEVKFARGDSSTQNDLMSKWPYNLLRPCNLPLDSENPVAYLGDVDFDWYAKEGVAAGTSVMLQIPTEMYIAHWYEKDGTGQNWEYKCVADTGRFPGSTYVKDLMRRSDGSETDYFYFPIFLGALDANGHYISAAGMHPAYNKSCTSLRTSVKTNGLNWQLIDVWAWEVLSDLAEIMSADADFKNTYGRGCSEFGGSESSVMPSLVTANETNVVTVSNTHNKKIRVGMTVNVGNAIYNSSVCKDREILKIENSETVNDAIEVTLSGDAFNVIDTSVMWRCAQITGATINMESPCGCAGENDGLHSNRVLYIEDFYGMLHTGVDGMNLKYNEEKMQLDVYVCKNPSKYSDTYEGYEYLDEALELDEAIEPNKDFSGYIKQNYYIKEYPILEIPKTVGGGAGSSSYIAAHCWKNKNGQRPFFGGSFRDGVSVSARSRLCLDGFGRSYWSYGSRPLRR